MKVTASLLTALIMAVEGTTPLRKTTEQRALQDNYYQYNGYQNQQGNGNYNGNNNGNNNGNQNWNGYNNGGNNGAYAGYDNFEEYLEAQMAARTFSFTGCSTT